MSFAECPHCGEDIEISARRIAKQERLVGKHKDNSYELVTAIADVSETVRSLSERIGEIEAGMDSFYAKIEKMDNFLRRLSQQQSPPQAPPRPMPQQPMERPPMPPPGPRPDFPSQPPR